MSKATQFVPLELGLIDEGRFLQEANFNLAKLQEAIRLFRAEFGDKAKGAKGKLIMEVTLACQEDVNAFSIKGQSRMTLPVAPPSITIAIAGDDMDDKPCLFVRNSGSPFDSPKQGVLSTQDGRLIEPVKP